MFDEFLTRLTLPEMEKVETASETAKHNPSRVSQVGYVLEPAAVYFLHMTSVGNVVTTTYLYDVNDWCRLFS
jgi:hypothetical protein